MTSPDPRAPAADSDADRGEPGEAYRPMALFEPTEPESVLRAFMADMHGWELHADALRRAVRRSAHPGSFWPAVQAGMDAIFARYCTAHPRPHGRRGSFGRPPNYDPQRETVRGVRLESPSRCVISTERMIGSLLRRFDYVLLKRRGEWRIDNRKILSLEGQPEPFHL